MTICQACSVEILSQDRYCKNCGAPCAASVEDLADTRRFDPSAPTLATASPNDAGSTVFGVPSTFPLAQGAGAVSRTASALKKQVQKNPIWIIAFLLVF